MASNCNKFHDVVSGDTCAAIAAAAAGISLTNFYTWNPAVGSSCSMLDLGDYVCIHVIGFASPTPKKKKSSKGNGVHRLLLSQEWWLTATSSTKLSAEMVVLPLPVLPPLP
jgi:hypothetical protein